MKQTTLAKKVLLVGAQSPDRSVLFFAMLADCSASRGWSERLTLRLCGSGRGAGQVSPEVPRLLESEGFSGIPESCPELSKCGDWSLDCDLVVSDDEDCARLLLSHPVARGKIVLLLPELLGEECPALDDRQASAVDYLEQLRPLIPEVLRNLVQGGAG